MIVVNNWDLRSVVHSEIKRLGNEADLNHIDVSGVTNMNNLFSDSIFNGDISNWDVSNVENMNWMFNNSQFNQDISNWNVSNVKNMWGMFSFSKFNQDISNWDVSNVENMHYMFQNSQFNGDISKWNVNLNYLIEHQGNFRTLKNSNDFYIDRIIKSFNNKNKKEFNKLSRKVYINHIRKRLKI